MNRGSRGEPCEIEIQLVAFNEAPIHESGKCPLGDLVRAAAQSFNEAPIHESGK